MRLQSWPGYHRHDLRCTPDSRKVPQTTQDLYMTFIDLTKAFDSVHREGHWRILKNIGCPDKFVSIVRSFHDGMMGCVLDKGEMSLHLT